MYEMKVLSPYLKDMETPKNMYDMNNLTCSKDVVSNNSGDPKLLLKGKADSCATLTTEEQAYTQAIQLIACQERLLSVLNRVDVHLEAICEMVGTLEKNDDDSVLLNVQEGKENENVHKYSIMKENTCYDKVDLSKMEIVINVHPSQAPYALIYLNILWKNVLFLNIETYVHSSLKMIAMDPTSKEHQEITLFEQYLKRIDFDLANTTAKRIHVLIIWKQCDKLNMLKNENGKVIIIYNETNILRYMSRIISPEKFQYGCTNYMDCNEIDKVMDICDNFRYKIHDRNSCNKLLKSLNVILKQKNNLYFGGENCNLADLCVLSVFTQYSDQIKVKDLSNDFVNWQKRLQTLLKVHF